MRLQDRRTPTVQDGRMAGLLEGTRCWCTLLVGVAIVWALVPLSAQRGSPPPQRSSVGSAPPPAKVSADTKQRAEAPVSGDYRLGPGDKLRIEVYKDTQLSQAVQVRPDGKITLPLIGDIDANGKTPAELRDVITTALKEYVNNPSVTVIVVEATAAMAYIMGEVNHPGSVALQGDMTVLQALAMAGGLRDFADSKNIRILRKGPSGVQTIRFNYKDAVKGEGTPMYLRPGDTVIVPD
jgi:polysaccharide export outer membrane protein